MKKNSELQISLVIFVFLVLGVSFFGYWSYKAEKSIVFKQIDTRLYGAAKIQTVSLSQDFNDRALFPISISKSEDTHNVKQLSYLAKALSMSYLYIVIEKNGKIYFTASSATDKEIQTGIGLTHYFDEYDDVDPIVKAAIQQHKLIYSDYEDKWGKFRSVFIPMVTQNGNHYTLCADISIADITKILHDNELRHISFILLLLIFIILLVFWRFRYFKKLAYYDPLTALPNRTELFLRFDFLLSNAQRNNENFAVLVLDLDNFKEVNDTFGHHVGDELLINVAKGLQLLLRKVDTASRIGGDEFVLLLPSTKKDGASKVAQKVLDSIADLHNLQNVTASVGIALYPSDGNDIDSLLKNADTAMYNAKKDGKNKFGFFTATDANNIE